MYTQCFSYTGGSSIHFTDTIYKDYVEDADTYEFSKYGSELIVAEAEKLFYAIGTNEYVGNLDGVIGYRCAKANTEAFKSFLTYVNNKSIEDHDNTNFLVDATIDIFKDHDASTKKLMLKRARNIYDRFDMLDLDMDN